MILEETAHTKNRHIHVHRIERIHWNDGERVSHRATRVHTPLFFIHNLVSLSHNNIVFIASMSININRLFACLLICLPEFLKMNHKRTSSTYNYNNNKKETN